jgi:hypothetical protein
MVLSMGLKEALTKLGAIDTDTSSRMSVEIMDLLTHHPTVNAVQEMLDGKATLAFSIPDGSAVGEFKLTRESGEDVVISPNVVKWRVA